MNTRKKTQFYDNDLSVQEKIEKIVTELHAEAAHEKRHKDTG